MCQRPPARIDHRRRCPHTVPKRPPFTAGQRGWIGLTNPQPYEAAMSEDSDKPKRRTTGGFWDRLSIAESSAVAKQSTPLAPYERPLRACYEAILLAAMLPCRRSGTVDLRLSGLLMKRIATDLRCVWNLCLTGYPAQAAAVATSLFENAFALEVIAGDTGAADKVIKAKTSELPWKVKELTKLRAEKLSRQAKVRWTRPR